MLNFCLVPYEASCLEDMQTIWGYTQAKPEDTQKGMPGKHFFNYMNGGLKMFVFELQNLKVEILSSISYSANWKGKKPRWNNVKLYIQVLVTLTRWSAGSEKSCIQDPAEVWHFVTS